MADRYGSGMSPKAIKHMSSNIIGDKDLPEPDADGPNDRSHDPADALEAGNRGLQIPEGHHVGRIGIEPVAGHDNEQCYVMEHHFELNPGHKRKDNESMAYPHPQKSVITHEHPAHGAIKSLFNGPTKRMVE